MAIHVTSVEILALLVAAMVACAQPASCILEKGMCDEHGHDETAYLQVRKDQPEKPDNGHEKPEKPMATDMPVQAHYNATDNEKQSPVATQSAGKQVPNCGPALYCGPGSVCCHLHLPDTKQGVCCKPNTTATPCNGGCHLR
eukprot:gnl/TRDRNA2_/TRDRNA2_174757_c1_seq1.p2 gnl/TRDRNA2_/TRDRNA2_174757_c1~~gnl/TRDRNA2_/TRDRNA2_174757_c1_seq1.p2  ORF type:complete len:142 (+),score=17.53 gnl/TRDRNA2_/TRDRNA2_174757_c1_seq1:68-493(+)